LSTFAIFFLAISPGHKGGAGAEHVLAIDSPKSARFFYGPVFCGAETPETAEMLEKCV
jgi:hypothetical protein